jgi:hypothetical protein
MTQSDALRLQNARYGRVYFSFKAEKLKINHSLFSMIFDTAKTPQNVSLLYTIKSSNAGNIIFDFSNKVIQYVDINQTAHNIYNNAWSETEIDNTLYSFDPATGQFKFKELFNIIEITVNPTEADLTPIYNLDVIFLLCNLTTNITAASPPIENVEGLEEV